VTREWCGFAVSKSGRGRVKAALEDELRDLVVVAHVVMRVLGDDHVGPGVTDEVDDETSLLTDPGS